MTRGPVNVLDANDGQTTVMGCEEQRAAGGVRKGGGRLGRGCLSEVLRDPGVFPLQPTSPGPPTWESAWPSGRTDSKLKVVRGGKRTRTLPQS